MNEKIYSLPLYYVRAEMIVHACMIELDQLTTFDIQENFKILKIDVQSQWRFILFVGFLKLLFFSRPIHIVLEKLPL